jgi:hypothetical protein
MMVGLCYVIQEMGIFPMSVANNFFDMPLPKYLDSKTVLIYRPHPVKSAGTEYLSYVGDSVPKEVYKLTGDSGALRQAAAPLHRGGLTHHMLQGHQLNTYWIRSNRSVDSDSNRSVDSDSNRSVDSDSSRSVDLNSNRSVDPDSKYGSRKVKWPPKRKKLTTRFKQIRGSGFGIRIQEGQNGLQKGED